MTEMRRCVFLDRDGTINVERGYVHRVEDLELIPGAAAAIRRLREAGFLVVVVTNQAGIGRGYYNEDDLTVFHRHLAATLEAQGAAIDAFYFCPHHPEKGVGPYLASCECRKPADGMIRAGACDFGIDLSRSYMVGDKASDIAAGLAAGCTPIMVRTGYGEAEGARRPEGVPLVDDLAAAADYIIVKSGREA